MRTVEDLRAELARRGLHADEVGRAEDREHRTDEGSRAFRRLPDGRCEVFTYGRGWTAEHQVFDSEADAVAVEAAKLDPPPAGVPDEATLARLRARAWEQQRLTRRWRWLSSREVSNALVAYVGHGRSSHPLSEEGRREAFGRLRLSPGSASEVEALVAESLSLEVDWQSTDLAGAGRLVATEMSCRHPWLSRKALDALAWNATYAWR